MNRPAKPRIQPFVFILFVIIGLLPIGVGASILLSGARQVQEQAIGNHLSEFADYVQMELAVYFQRKMLQVANLALVPQIREVVNRSNMVLPGSEKPGRRIEEIEKAWPSLEPESSAVLREILSNPASEFLRNYNQAAANFGEILVTDAHGRLVAATNKTTDYFQADERWWRYSYQGGAGGHFLSDITLDESSNLFYAMEMAEPILDPSTNQVIGVIKAIMDSREVFGLINEVRVGRTGEAMLIGSDGIVITSPEIGIAQQLPFKHFETVRTAANMNRRMVQTPGDDSMFLGLPRTRLKDIYPQLDWYVLVTEPKGEALAPFQNISSRFLYIMLFTITAVLVLSALFSWILRKPVIEIDPHLERL